MPIKKTEQETREFNKKLKPFIYGANILALSLISANFVNGFVKGWNSVPAKSLENSVKSAQVSLNHPEEKTQDYELIKYVVKSGDTFSKIADANDYDYEFLKEFNPQFKEKGYNFEEGDVVYMPKLEGVGK